MKDSRHRIFSGLFFQVDLAKAVASEVKNQGNDLVNESQQLPHPMCLYTSWKAGETVHRIRLLPKARS